MYVCMYVTSFSVFHTEANSECLFYSLMIPLFVKERALVDAIKTMGAFK